MFLSLQCNYEDEDLTAIKRFVVEDWENEHLNRGQLFLMASQMIQWQENTEHEDKTFQKWVADVFNPVTELLGRKLGSGWTAESSDEKTESESSEEIEMPKFEINVELPTTYLEDTEYKYNSPAFWALPD